MAGQIALLSALTLSRPTIAYQSRNARAVPRLDKALAARPQTAAQCLRYRRGRGCSQVWLRSLHVSNRHGHAQPPAPDRSKPG
jgi:hypothetical protein